MGIWYMRLGSLCVLDVRLRRAMKRANKFVLSQQGCRLVWDCLVVRHAFLPYAWYPCTLTL